MNADWDRFAAEILPILFPYAAFRLTASSQLRKWIRDNPEKAQAAWDHLVTLTHEPTPEAKV